MLGWCRGSVEEEENVFRAVVNIRAVHHSNALRVVPVEHVAYTDQQHQDMLFILLMQGARFRFRPLYPDSIDQSSYQSSHSAYLPRACAILLSTDDQA